MQVISAIQLSVRIRNVPGAAAIVFEQLSSAGVHLTAFGGYSPDSHSGILHFVPQDPSLTVTTLRDAGYIVMTDPVIVISLPNGYVTMPAITRRLANANIGIARLYMSNVREGSGSVIIALTEPALTADAIAMLRATSDS